MGGDGVTKEDTRFTPGETVREEDKPLTSEGMKGMRDGKNLPPIQVIGRS